MSLASTTETTVWIVGTPPYALCYKDGNRAVPVELQSFRPDPTKTLRPGKRYKAGVAFEELLRGIRGVRTVSVYTPERHVFVRIR